MEQGTIRSLKCHTCGRLNEVSSRATDFECEGCNTPSHRAACGSCEGATWISGRPKSGGRWTCPRCGDKNDIDWGQLKPATVTTTAPMPASPTPRERGRGRTAVESYPEWDMRAGSPVTRPVTHEDAVEERPRMPFMVWLLFWPITLPMSLWRSKRIPTAVKAGITGVAVVGLAVAIAMSSNNNVGVATSSQAGASATTAAPDTSPPTTKLDSSGLFWADRACYDWLTIQDGINQKTMTTDDVIAKLGKMITNTGNAALSDPTWSDLDANTKRVRVVLTEGGDGSASIQAVEDACSDPAIKAHP